MRGVPVTTRSVRGDYRLQPMLLRSGERPASIAAAQKRFLVRQMRAQKGLLRGGLFPDDALGPSLRVRIATCSGGGPNLNGQGTVDQSNTADHSPPRVAPRSST